MSEKEQKKRIEGLPSWMLTPAEERTVLEEYQKEVWRRCDEYVQAFRKCEAGAGYGGFGVLFECKKEGDAMRQCVDRHHQHQYVDEVRDAYIKKKRGRESGETNK